MKKKRIVLKFNTKKPGVLILALVILGLLICLAITTLAFGNVAEQTEEETTTTIPIEVKYVDIPNTLKPMVELQSMMEEKIIVEPTVDPDYEETTEEPTEPTTEAQRDINLYDFTRRSGLTAEEFDAVISRTLNKVGHTDSAFYGLGKALKDVEDVYNINGLYLLGIGSEESWWGCYGPAKNRNNYTGMGPVKGRSSSNGRAIFYSSYDCFWNTGRNIRENYINCGLYSLNSIGAKYCPPTAGEWASNVNSHTNRYRQSVMELYDYNFT